MPPRQAANLNNLKQTPIPVVSTNLQLVNGDGTVTRSGKLLLQQLQASEALQGTHASRPAPGDAPDGAVYVESDRTVIYSNINGAWQYIAGTMWGTINPDQRPTDLGANDAGFDFRTVDQPAREFIWSQVNWIEVTPVRYGTHAQRLAVVIANVIEQMLWVETDRTVLYQLMQVSGPTPVWQYIAGTMWGTLSPDQRPTDLGTHDAGFDFRGTDQQREFIWSQTAWIEVTPVGGVANLTHPNVVTKVSASGTITEGGITDLSAGNSGYLVITAGGQIGIGTANPIGPLEIHTATNENVIFGNNGGFTTMSAVNDAASAYVPMQYYASAHYLMANVGIGITSATYALTLGADSAGKPSTNTWTIISDTRTKRNVNRFEGDIEVIRKLDPIVGEYNGLGGTPEGARVVGFDAAKLREIVPQCVSSVKRKLRESDAEETEVLGVNIHEILFHMLRAVQQIDRRLSKLEV